MTSYIKQNKRYSCVFSVFATLLHLRICHQYFDTEGHMACKKCEFWHLGGSDLTITLHILECQLSLLPLHHLL